MADWEIVKGTAIILAGQASVTVSPTLPAVYDVLSDVFPIITSTRYSGMGVTSGGGNQNLNAFTAYIDEPRTTLLLGQVVFKRLGVPIPAVNCRVEWEVWCWIGPPAAPNRARVLLQGNGAVPSNSLTMDSSDFTANDPTRVACLLTGQASGRADLLLAGSAQFTLSLIDNGNGTHKLRATRGRTSNPTEPDDHFSFVALEFGPYWRPAQALTFRSDDPDRPDVVPGTEQRAWVAAVTPDEYGILDITRPTLPRSGLPAALSPLLDIGRTMIQVQYRNAGAPTQGNDDNGENAELDSEGLSAAAAAVGHHNDGAGHAPPATALNSLLTRRNTGTGDTLKFTRVWFMEYAPPAGIEHEVEMGVQHVHRYFDTLNTAEEQVDQSTTTADPWLPALADVLELSSSGVAFGLAASSDGTAAGTPRGWDNMRLLAGSPINLTTTRSESNQEERQSASIVTMPSLLRHGEHGNRSEAAMAGSQDSQAAAAGSQASEAAVAG